MKGERRGRGKDRGGGTEPQSTAFLLICFPLNGFQFGESSGEEKVDKKAF